MKGLTCFKAYDIRGRLGDELNPEIAYRIGRAYGDFLSPQSVVLGGDVRLTSEELKMALASGLMDAGADVFDIGMCGTEEVYFATAYLNADGGICVTASHNPIDYNGMKLVKSGSRPISCDSGLKEIKEQAESWTSGKSCVQQGRYSRKDTCGPYVEHLLTYISLANITPMRLVVNAGNGAAGHVIDEIERRFQHIGVPVEFIKINHEPDGHFPRGIPNPLLPENREDTANAVRVSNANMGIAWDGDFDRCFLFDEYGTFIEGYYIVGLLAEAFLAKHKSAKIIHDPRLVWNTQEIVLQSGGIPVMSKTGHAFIKDRMRKEDAVYGGEMSAHHYFRDFQYCDSGMIPWLLVMELICVAGKPLSELVGERISRFPSSGEINRNLLRPQDALAGLEQQYFWQALTIDKTDGLSMEFADWRFNVRSSNTEPVVRLNVESRGDDSLVRHKTDELLALLKQYE